MSRIVTLMAQIDADIPKMEMGNLIRNGLNIVYFVVGLVAVVVIIVAGYQYITRNGDPERAKKALHTILDCAIGIAVVIFAFAITNFVAGRV
jgi:uncharacterized membrane protein